MHAVVIQVTVKPELLEEFTAAILHNARESVARDPGCLRFDVIQQYDDPGQWLFYELYTDRAAHEAHRKSAHFLAYGRVAERAVLSKTSQAGAVVE